MTSSSQPTVSDHGSLPTPGDICVPDLFTFLSPGESLFEIVSTSSDLSSEISLPFSDLQLDPDVLIAERRKKRLTTDDVMAFTQDFRTLMKELSPSSSDEVYSMSTSEILAESKRLVDLSRTRLRKAPTGSMAETVASFALGIEEYRSTDEEVLPAAVGVKKRKPSLKKAVSAALAAAAGEEDLYDTSSGMWRMLSAYDSLTLSQPGEKEGAWNQTDPIPWKTLEQSRSKDGNGARCSSEIDGSPSTNWKSKEEAPKMNQKPIEIPAVIEQDDEEYNMTHPRRGVALIFNHQHFEQNPREGSEKDVETLIASFENLGFETRTHVDLTYTQFFEVLRRTAEENHGDCDCLVVTVMSHGNNGQIACSDNVSYPPEKLWEPFTADKCPSLASKPKLFFIQACRGKKTDDGVKMMLRRTQTDTTVAAYTIPNCADILVAYSTVKEYCSWREPTGGSWFIQVLCEELNKHGHTRELLSILTMVNRRIATEFQSSVPDEKSMDLKKQVPAFISMLTRQVFFRTSSRRSSRVCNCSLSF